MSPAPTQRIVLVTGASRGMGLEWVRQLLREPKTTFVIGLVRSVQSVSPDLAALQGDRLVLVEGDLGKRETFAAVLQSLEDQGVDHIDCLINNAGVMIGAGAEISKGISQSTVEEWDEEWSVNVVGPVFFTIAFLPLLRKGLERRVINIGSMLGDLHFSKTANVHYASYSATKAALHMATLKFHEEFKSEGFVFVSVNPGWVATEMSGETKDLAPLQPEESVSKCLSFVNRCHSKHGGGLFTLDGQVIVADH